MNEVSVHPNPPPLPPAVPAPAPEQTLRRLFLTLFLRGRAARGLKKEAAPKSVGSKLTLTLVFYALFGLLAFVFVGQTTFALSAYLHAMTLMFVGMFVASSSGEVLFNQEEADILLHRPVTPRSLLWAKIVVLVRVSLWLASAFNLAGLVAGTLVGDGSWLFPLPHLLSTAVSTMFCTSCVVLAYQLCLRWFGRERLDGLMTLAQVVMAIGVVAAGQIVPQVLIRLQGKLAISPDIWWIWLLPPAWFAGFDDALAGSGSRAAWLLAAWGLLVTGATVWAAFGRLAGEYGAGLQQLNERVDRAGARRIGRRRLDRLLQLPPLSWWLKDTVARATFLLVAAYLMRDRDVKLRVFPSLAPFLVMPVVLVLQGARSESGSFGVAFSGAYVAMVPLLAIGLLQYSQHWPAADIFRVAPLPGPAPLNRGLRRAVLVFLVVPFLVLCASLTWLISGKFSMLGLLLPGIIATPLGLIWPCLKGEAVPLSQPADEAKSAGRGVQLIGFILGAAVLTGLSVWAWNGGWFGWLLAVETAVVAAGYFGLRAIASRATWS